MSTYKINTPVKDEIISQLRVGDFLEISGIIYAGRDAVLPKIAQLVRENKLAEKGIDLKGTAIIHTAVSPAGIGPTSSNKVEIEGTMEVLSQAGVKIHIGKGALKPETVKTLRKNNSIFAVTPPVTAVLTKKVISQAVAAYEEDGMEAFYRLVVKDIPAIIAIANGESIFD